MNDAIKQVSHTSLHPSSFLQPRLSSLDFFILLWKIQCLILQGEYPIETKRRRERGRLLMSSVLCLVAWVCMNWCCHCVESKWLMMSDSSAPVSASRSQVSQPDTGEHRSLDRVGILLHRRNSVFHRRVLAAPSLRALRSGSVAF